MRHVSKCSLPCHSWTRPTLRLRRQSVREVGVRADPPRGQPQSLWSAVPPEEGASASSGVRLTSESYELPAIGESDQLLQDRPFGRTTLTVLWVATGLVLVVAVILRFWTKSDLWLDEALTVDIAKQPIHEIPSYLRRDGAPPLFYFLLHFWLGWFGTSDEAVRSLSGLFGVITLPVVWLVGRRLGGRSAAWGAMLLVAASPFAVRYDTEARMYSLVVLLTALGFLALDRALHHPRPGNLLAVAAVTGLLLYAHYWSMYLIFTIAMWLIWEAWRGRPEWRSGARAAIVAVLVGCLTFIPWLPIFLYQSVHTGTPWATPANFAAMVDAVSTFAGGSTTEGRALALAFFALCGLGLLGRATDGRHIEVDLRTRPLGRPLAVAVVGTLALAIIGGFVGNSAFDARYASVVFIPLILLVAIGLETFRDRRVRTAILAFCVVAGLAGAWPDVTTNRTQAGQVAAALASRGHVGDVVALLPRSVGTGGESPSRSGPLLADYVPA